MEDLTPIEDNSARLIPNEEILRVYRLLEEMNRFLHQPLNYGEDSPVSQWLDTGVYAELNDVYYNLFWTWLPDSEKKRIEES